jgi:3-methyladenine DNA glycosylase AlkC
MFKKSDDFKGKGVSLGMLSFYGLGDYKKVLPYFESAAASSDWEVRELAQMFSRKLIKKHPGEMKKYLLKLAKSKDANIRRFVGETLRPVQENRWFYKNPDYPLAVLKNMFQESSPYPRTSVGNNLSDLARQLPELVYDLVAELVESGNENSYWIAYRACRNLVKKEPVKVMDLLKVDEYKYKKRIHKRSGYPGN